MLKLTIVAYKNKTLAADTAVWSGNVYSGDTRKLIRTTDGLLAGTSGDTITCQRFRRWVEMRGEEWKSDEEAFQAIVIDRDGEVSLFHGKASEPCKIDAPFYAIGYGAEIAMGAMAAGASAEKAVAIAIERHAFCGGKVDFERYECPYQTVS